MSSQFNLSDAREDVGSIADLERTSVTPTAVRYNLNTLILLNQRGDRPTASGTNEGRDGGPSGEGAETVGSERSG